MKTIQIQPKTEALLYPFCEKCVVQGSNLLINQSVYSTISGISSEKKLIYSVAICLKFDFTAFSVDWQARAAFSFNCFIVSAKTWVRVPPMTSKLVLL